MEQLSLDELPARTPTSGCERFKQIRGGYVLREQGPRDAPSVEAVGHDNQPVELDYTETILYAFPNPDGCRCSAQVQQYEQLHRKIDTTTVYGLAPSPVDELAELAERFDVTHTLISDPHGSIAKQFGLEAGEGDVERATLFIKKGKIVDTVRGMHGVSINESGDKITLGEEPELVRRVEHPSVITILGKRGAGKSSTAYWVGEQMFRHKGITPVTVAVPEYVHAQFPSEWVHVDSIAEAPPDSVVIVDEAYRMLHSREWQQNDSVKISKLINLSRQCNRSIVFVSQSSKQIDGNVPLESDVVLMKEPGALHSRLERREMRPIVEEAEGAFGNLPSTHDRRGYALLVSDDGETMVETREADFFTDTLSNAFGGVCGQYQNDD